MKSKNLQQENNESLLAVGLTLARLPLAMYMAKRIEDKKSITGALVAFVAADIADGVIARKLEADGPKRRTLDVIIDRVSVVVASTSMWKVNRFARPFLSVLAAKESAVSLVNTAHYKQTGEVVNGTGVHKLSSLSVAAFAVAASTHNKAATITTGTIATVINIGLAADYFQNYINPHGTVQDGVRHISLDTLQNSQQ